MHHLVGILRDDIKTVKVWKLNFLICKSKYELLPFHTSYFNDCQEMAATRLVGLIM